MCLPPCPASQIDDDTPDDIARCVAAQPLIIVSFIVIIIRGRPHAGASLFHANSVHHMLAVLRTILRILRSLLLISISVYFVHKYNKLCGRPPQYAPAPCKLIFDLLPLKVVFQSRAWATSVPILAFLCLSLLDLGPMYATDRRQTRVIA